ncbi:MAG: hypothetical protein QXP29_06590 [Candidatus Nezhaarchaeales archaeon]
MRRIRKTITIPRELVEWAENIIKNGEYSGICSLSGFIEYLMHNEREKKRVK